MNKIELAVLGISVAISFGIALAISGDFSTAMAHSRGR